MDRNVAYAQALATAMAADISSPAVAAALQNDALTRDQFTSIVYRDVAKGLRGDPGPAIFPNVRAFARQVVDIGVIRTRKSTGLSDTYSSDIGGISGLVGAIAGAVGAIYSTKINTDAQKQLATIKANEAQIAQNSQTIAAKSALIQNATSNGLLVAPTGSLVDPSAGIVTAGPLAAVGGLPGVAIGTAAIAVLVGGYYAMKG
jgi:hypothetical protein